MNLQIVEGQPVQTNMTMCDGLFVKHMTFEAGCYIPQHSHETPHLSVLALGAVRVWEDGVEVGDFRAPKGIVIKAHVKHTFLALERSVVLCVHRVDDGKDPHIHEEASFSEVEQCLS